MPTRPLAILALLFALSLPAPAWTRDVADVPNEDIRIAGRPDMRYFLIGPAQDAPVPADGYSLLVVMPGGDGNAGFNPFIRCIWKYALPAGYIVAQPVAVQWSPTQEIIWPTTKDQVKGARFSTEEFVEAVIADVHSRHKVNPRRVFTLSWSSSGPTAYAIALQDTTAVTGSFVAMSVWHPQRVPSVANAKSRPFYIYHSPDDTVCPIRLARQAQKALVAEGALVKFVEYPGGHGWTSGNIYGDIRAGIEWLENAVATPDEEKASPTADATEHSFPSTPEHS